MKVVSSISNIQTTRNHHEDKITTLKYAKVNHLTKLRAESIQFENPNIFPLSLNSFPSKGQQSRKIQYFLLVFDQK